MLPPLCGYHRHVSSLQTLAALSASRELHLHSHQVSHSARGRLSDSLLKWCDNLFGILFCPGRLLTHPTIDAVWNPSNLELWIPDEHCAERTAVVIHLLNHVDWRPDRVPEPGLDNFHQNLIKYHLSRCARAITITFPECQELFLRMLTRLYSLRTIIDLHLPLVTCTLLTTGVKPNVREHIRNLDTHYYLHQQMIVDTMTDPAEMLSFAVKIGDHAYVLANGPFTNSHHWRGALMDAIATSDTLLIHYLWTHREQIQYISHYFYVDVLCAALTASDNAVLLLLLREILAEVTLLSSTAAQIWSSTRDVRSADLLIQHGCPYDNAVFHCRSPETVAHLISIGAPLIPSTVREAVTALSSNPSIAYLLMDAWSTTSVPASDYLCTAIRACRDEFLLRDLVKVFDLCFSRNTMLHESVTDAFLHAHLYVSITFLAVCLEFGADIDARDIETGTTKLQEYLRAGKDQAVRFLWRAGASADPCDYDQLAALDIYPRPGSKH